MVSGMRINACVVALVILGGHAAQASQKKATPPTTEELACDWVGFDRGGSEFMRLELHADGSGYFALVSPPPFTSHDYGVQLYKVNNWKAVGWHIEFELSPLSANAERASMKADVVVSSLRLEVSGSTRRWKIDSILYMESALGASNRETKLAISAVQRR